MGSECPRRRFLGNAPSYDVDFYSDDVIRDPWPHYAAMRALGPVVWLPRHGNYAVTRYQEAREVLKNWRVYSSAGGVAADDTGCAFTKGNTLASDPPSHDEMRAASGAPLLPGALQSIRGQVEDAATRLVDDLVARRTFDGMADLANVLPLTIVTQLVGLPEDGRENMLNWAAAAFDLFGIQNERGQKGFETLKEMRHWIATQATPDRLKPGSWSARLHDLVKLGHISQEMVPVLMRDYIGPSLDTTISATGHLIYQLGKNPDQWRRLRDNPSFIPNAVNEAVRLGSPIRSFSRTVAQDCTLSGAALPAGSRVMVLFASANRDELKFSNPDQFDVSRSGFDHIGFGHGIHMCVGMHLARLEMESLLKALIRRVDAIDVGEPAVALNNTIHAFASLPVSIRPDTAVAAVPRVDTATAARASSWIELEVVDVTRQTPDIVSIDLVAEADDRLPPFTAGAHIDVEAAPGVVRQYSLCGDPADQTRYRLAVLRESHSRGGSAAIHHRIQPGTRLRVRRPRNLFPLDASAPRALLFAAGIGITPILAMAYHLQALGRDFLLHYAIRSRRHAAFLDDLLGADFAEKVRLHISDEGSRLDMDSAIVPPDGGLRAYICGPSRFVTGLVTAARARGWPNDHLHVERFAGDVIADGEPFTIVAERSGKVFEIPRDKTILAVLQDAGIDIESSCQSGVCATCLVDVLEGEPDHRDLVQTPEEKASNRRIAVCCSRAHSRQLVLDI